MISWIERLRDLLVPEDSLHSKVSKNLKFKIPKIFLHNCHPTLSYRRVLAHVCLSTPHTWSRCRLPIGFSQPRGFSLNPNQLVELDAPNESLPAVGWRIAWFQFLHIRASKRTRAFLSLCDLLRVCEFNFSWNRREFCSMHEEPVTSSVVLH